MTGSSGKTTTVSLLAHILSSQGQTFCQVFGNGIEDTTKTIKESQRSDKFVVMEVGTARPGQIFPQAKLVRPNISIVTLVALEHYSAFRSVEAVASEKAQLVRVLPRDGVAILNFDNDFVRAMAAGTKARVVGFGIEHGSYRISDLRIGSDGRLSLTLQPPSKASLRIETQLLGTYSWLAVAAAATCALELGVSAEVVVSRIASFTPVPGRMSVHQIAHGPKFILDTTKAPWFSMSLPFGVISKIVAPRRRVVIGQISDYAGNPKAKYRDAYRAAREFAAEVIFIGSHAHRVKPVEDDVAQGRFRVFSSVRDCADYVRETAIEDEVIFVKSSGNLHLERLWLHCATDVQCWPTECGFNSRACVHCLPDKPFAEHGKFKYSKSRVRL
ncbi:MAG: Mur ligase family protein [Hyphomicrobium sp.]|uniref:Mur ligase family protein n=1 Tax=Hyphomicrobium sp. TaxID=82 RepID=UPI0039E6DAD0